jgi:hypothetical protein
MAPGFALDVATYSLLFAELEAPAGCPLTTGLVTFIDCLLPARASGEDVNEAAP